MLHLSQFDLDSQPIRLAVDRASPRASRASRGLSTSSEDRERRKFDGVASVGAFERFCSYRHVDVQRLRFAASSGHAHRLHCLKHALTVKIGRQAAKAIEIRIGLIGAQATQHRAAKDANKARKGSNRSEVIDLLRRTRAQRLTDIMELMSLQRRTPP